MHGIHLVRLQGDGAENHVNALLLSHERGGDASANGYE
jgi:hypothetical protein